MFNSDRIIRDTSGTMYLKMLRSCGVKILSVTEGELFKNDDVDELMSLLRYKIEDIVFYVFVLHPDNRDIDNKDSIYDFKSVSGISFPRVEIDTNWQSE